MRKLSAFPVSFGPWGISPCRCPFKGPFKGSPDRPSGGRGPGPAELHRVGAPQRTAALQRDGRAAQRNAERKGEEPGLGSD